MSVDKTIAKKSRAHTRYRLSDGTIVPGVTTVLGVLAKPALIPWANKMGLQGIDTSKYVDNAAIAGTAAHEMIEMYFKGLVFDESKYPDDLITLAENGFIKFLEWETQHDIKIIGSEMPLVSERYRFGGTIDLYAELDGVRTLIDFKTNSSGVYDEMKHQAVAYKNLLEENGHLVEQIIILRLGKSEKMDFEPVVVTGNYVRWEIFKNCLNIYNLNKKLGKL